ncbi:MAG: hypothetical protein R2771_10005 [Saprospiraceae bacterium]
MKKNILFLLLALPIFVMGQRLDIPKDNPGNHLDLKVVYQPFTIYNQNQNGHILSSKNDSLLLLKVNGAYYGKKKTGISKEVFNSYLTECPEALKISNSGFDLYSKSKTYGFSSKALRLVGGLGTIVYGIKYASTKSNSDLFTGIGFGIGWGSSFLLNRYSTKLYNRADKKMIESIEAYRLNCFAPLENNTIYDDSLKNGGNNSKENIFIEYFKNDARSLFFNAGLGAGITSYSDYKNGIACNAMVSKSGFALMGDFMNNKFSTNISKYDGYEWTVTASIPIFKSIKERKQKLNVGKYLGMTAMGDFKSVSVLSSLNIEGGIQNIVGNIEGSTTINSFTFDSKINRAGISYSGYYFVKYKFNDNRFSPKMRYNLVYLRLYAHALLNINTEYDIIQHSIFNEDPKFNKYGGVLGWDLIYSRLPIGNLKINLEGGQYNYTGDSFRYDF